MAYKRYLLFILLLILLCGLAAPVCAAKRAKAKPPKVEPKGKVVLAHVDSDCAVTSTSVAAVVLEKMGYEVETLSMAPSAMWMATATGDVDGFVSAKLPVTHEIYREKQKGKVDDLGTNVGVARLGWAVPDYVDIGSIEELNANVDKFGGRVVGVKPDSTIMQLSQKAIAEYGLDRYELVAGNDDSMTNELGNAINTNAWVVVTAWSPHWMFGKWNLKYLADPKKVLGGEETIHTVARKGLKQDMPEVYTFLDKFAWDSLNQLQMVMAWNHEEGASPKAAALRFIKENPDTVQKWIGK